MRSLISWIALVSLVSVTLSAPADRRQSVVDSLKKRPVDEIANPDPVSYQDPATYGTFKPNTPPTNKSDQIDSLHPLINGWRVRVAITPNEDSAKALIKIVAKKFSQPTQLRYINDQYEIMFGNFADLSKAQTAVNEAYRCGYIKAVPVESKIPLQVDIPSDATDIDTTPPVQSREKCWQVQVAAYKSKESADSLAMILKHKTTEPVTVLPLYQGNYRVRVGNARSVDSAMKIRDDLSKLGYQETWLTTSEKP